jgi:tight adherence protein C
MKKVYIGLSITFMFIIISVNNIFAQDEVRNYSEMSERELVEFYRDSCNKEYTSNCYQLAMIYKDLDKNKEAVETLKSDCTRENRKIKNNGKDPEPEQKLPTRDELEPDIAEKLDKGDKCVLYKELTQYEENISTYYLKKACPNPKSNIGEIAACNMLNGKVEYEGSMLIYYGALFLAGLAVFFITKTIFQDQDQHQAQENLEDGSKVDDLAKHGIIVKVSRPFFRRYFTPLVAGMKGKKLIKEKYKRPLAAAGLTGVLTPEDFFAFKLFLILGFPITFVALKAFLETDWPMSMVPVSGVVGFYYPDLWIRGKIQNRQMEIIQNMPFGVDMLALSVEAGLDFIAAMSKVIEKSKKNSLTEEFEIVIKEIRIGASRAEALRNLSWRVDLIQISSFCATLIAADSVGASIGPILKSLAVEIRQKKSAEVEKAGATAATKILFPMMFLIVPAVLIIVFSPIIVDMIYGK